MTSWTTDSVSGRGMNTPGPHGKLQVAEMGHAGDVLQRNALRPLGHKVRVTIGFRRIAQEHGPQAAEADAQQMIRQQLRVHARAGNSGVRQELCCLADGLRQAQSCSECHQSTSRAYSPMASRRACSSISMADWMTGSRSPFMTWSRL